MLQCYLWCKEHGARGTKASKQEQFKGLTRFQIEYALDNPVVVRNKYDVLTEREICRLKDWMRASEACNNPAKDEEGAGVERDPRASLGQKILYYIVQQCNCMTFDLSYNRSCE